MRSVAIASILIASVTAAGRGQELQGAVFATGSQTPVVAVTIVLLDDAGRTLARGVTDAKGRYRIVMPAGTRRVRAMRLGFRPRTVSYTAGEGQLDIRLDVIATLLETVTVADQPGCRARPDRAAALALWAQARAGLTSVVVAREANPMQALRLSYYRIVGESRPGILSQTVEGERATVTRPFGASRMAEEYIREGFRSDSADGRMFYAPDADVLLDEAFTRGYCFHLARADSTRPTQLGLAFEPMRRVRGRTQIEGALWVDSAARALVDLEFRYIGLDLSEMVLRPGGRVAFRTMPTGVPLIDQWFIRVVSAVRERIGGSSERLEAHEIGGELARARWNDSTEWRADLGVVRGVLLSQGTRLPNREIWLAATDYRAVTDSLGGFEIRDLVPGRYTFSVPDRQLNALGLELTRAQAFTVRRGEVVTVDAELPTHADFISAKCRDTTDASTASLLVGRVFGSDGKPTKADVTVRQGERKSVGVSGDNLWPKIYEGRAGEVKMFHSVYEGASGFHGLFYLCRLPPDTDLRIEAAEYGQEAVGEVRTYPRSHGIFTVLLKLRPR